MFEFRCENGHVSEQLQRDEVRWVTCSVCGKEAERILSASRIGLDPISGHFPGATMSWEKRREEKMAQERKNKANHGTYGDGTWERTHGHS
jgi:hypothetical protein